MSREAVDILSTLVGGIITHDRWALELHDVEDLSGPF